MQLLLEQEKIQPPRNLAKLSIWRDGIGVFDIDTQYKLNYKNAFEGC